MMGGDDDNVDNYGNTNNIDAGNENMNADGREGDVGGDTHDDGAADNNDFAIDHATYTADADNDDVGHNYNKDDANDADNDNANDDTKDGNNVVINEVPMLMMMKKGKIESSILKNTCPVQSLMSLRRRDIKLEMRMISSLA